MKFKPEDFEFNAFYNERYQAADIANRLLQSWLDAAPVVYKDCVDGGVNGWFGPSFCAEDATHRARLVCIEELKPKVCNHEPIAMHMVLLSEGIKCQHCGKKLTATWKADE